MKKISLKIMLAIIICSIATSTVLCVVSIQQTSAVMNEEVEQMLSYASEKYSNQLSIDFKNTEGLVDSLAANVSVTFKPPENKVNELYLKDYKLYLEDIIRETLQYSDIAYGLYFTFNPELTFPTEEEVWYAFDATGTPQSIKPDLSLSRRDFSEPIKENMQYYFKPIIEKKGAWTGPYVDPDVNFEMLSYSRAVYVDGVLIGVAGADILTDATIDIVKTMKIYKGSTSFLFDDQYNLIVSSRDLGNEMYAQNQLQIKNLIKADDTGIFHYTDLNEEYILALSQLSNGWIMGITQPTKEVFSPIRGLALVLALLTIISIVITIIFGVYFARRFSKPIMSASDQLKLLEMGDYTHDIPIEFLNRKDDLGEFHNAILAIQSEMKKEADDNREKDILMIYQSKQAKIGEMVGNISHQWKQPLNSINLILMNLYDDYKFKELSELEFKKTIDKLMNIVENMAETIQDFTDFLKPNREKIEFSLTESIHMALTLMEASLKYNNINVELKIDPNLKLLGYQNEFSHVLFNILNNARDAIVEGKIQNGVIIIAGFINDENAIIEITNTGDHIPVEILNNAFEPYFTTKGEKDGTGIGLYISQVIVEQRMNGTIELKNVDLGVCCRICIKTREEVG